MVSNQEAVNQTAFLVDCLVSGDKYSRTYSECVFKNHWIIGCVFTGKKEGNKWPLGQSLWILNGRFGDPCRNGLGHGIPIVYRSVFNFKWYVGSFLSMQASSSHFVSVRTKLAKLHLLHFIGHWSSSLSITAFSCYFFHTKCVCVCVWGGPSTVQENDCLCV